MFSPFEPGKNYNYDCYAIILSILTPYGANDFCASNRWSFVESTLLKVKAYVVCICDSMKKIIIIVNTSNGDNYS